MIIFYIQGHWNPKELDANSLFLFIIILLIIWEFQITKLLNTNIYTQEQWFRIPVLGSALNPVRESWLWRKKSKFQPQNYHFIICNIEPSTYKGICLLVKMKHSTEIGWHHFTWKTPKSNAEKSNTQIQKSVHTHVATPWKIA
jgi:hypothetical protein